MRADDFEIVHQVRGAVQIGGNHMQALQIGVADRIARRDRHHFQNNSFRMRAGKAICVE
ncbi:MAG: hypothetical protein N4A53_07105 [Pelagimonas sp.]|nr:hypothetical protein [Pelagimonas sp.]